MMRAFILCFMIGLSACTGMGNSPRHYLPDTDYGTRLTPPLKKGNPAWRDDLAAVLRAQKNMTPRQLADARHERDLRPELTAAALGKHFTRTRRPVTFALLDKVEDDCKKEVEEAKIYWDTLRPYQEDARVKVPLKAHSNRAYPSGHTACSQLVADVLASLYPAKKSALHARAGAIAQHRVMVGMHYPHDLAGGRELAEMLYHDMQASAAYQSDLAAAQREIRK